MEVIPTLLYWRLPKGMPTGRNENFKFERLTVGEPSERKTSSGCVEGS